jgi:N-acetylmuramoyl-L-alanine amidase
MPSRKRSFVLILLFFSTCFLCTSLPCFAVEEQEIFSSSKVNGPAAGRSSAELHSNSKGQNDAVEKLSPSRNCTGNPFFIGHNYANPKTTRPEGEASSWAQPSTSGNRTSTLPEKVAAILNLQEPRVIHRSPEKRKNSNDETQVTEQLAPSLNCTGNPFFTTVKTNAIEPSEPVRQASIAPQRIKEYPSLKQDSHNPRRGFVIILDPGHGGKDPGAVSKDGLLKEKDLTLDIAIRAKAKIEEALPDCTVMLTRNKDIFLELGDRTFIANSMNADLFISIHCNASSQTHAEGIETYFLSKSDSQKSVLAAARENGTPLAQVTDLENSLMYRMASYKTSESVKLATTIHDQLTQNLGQTLALGRNRGIKAAPLHVLLDAKMPAIMIECGFISNNSEKDKLASPEYRDSIARGVAGGSISYLKPGQEGIKTSIATNMWRRLRGMW